MSSSRTTTSNFEMESIEKSQEDLIREQQYAIESLENEIDSLKRRLNSVSSDDTEDRLYEMSGGDRLKRKAEAIRETWLTAPQKKFRTSSAARELVARAWPDMRPFIVHPPGHIL